MEGFIEKIDYANGVLYRRTAKGSRSMIRRSPSTFRIQMARGRVVIITKGRYSAGQSPDPRMEVDQGNTTVRTAMGYPMCVPGDASRHVQQRAWHSGRS